ncbi:hypothetical protein FHS18_000742 [Paenibacillus phyllosphaerae]|uniref:Lipoprotein n=1 Tax=Paenibacillus phyllosphaerae TaxID=274593 RepID=A0A7W5AUC9_9BACL|nr:hypothetical protein [Paenibacillus phyllosphaerae]MBB3108714.1 hypothetical protein [Paenibacillus phyllosphaerae]
MMTRRIIIGLGLILLACTGNGCSSSDTEAASDSGQLASVLVSIYRSDSIKAQPELIQAIHEPDELQSVENWMASGTESTLPPEDQLGRIFTYSLGYENDEGQVVRYVSYMVVESADGKRLFKPYEIKPAYNLDHYEDAMLGSIIELIGKQGWKLASE